MRTSALLLPLALLTACPADSANRPADGAAVDGPATDGGLAVCEESTSEVTLDGHAVIWRYLYASQTHAQVIADMTTGLSLDVSAGFRARWQHFTGPTSTEISEDNVTAMVQQYEKLLAALNSRLEVNSLQLDLGINPCHSIGTLGGESSTSQSACLISPIKPACQADWLAFVRRATREHLALRPNTGDVVLSFGGAEVPRELWFDSQQPDLSFRRHPDLFLELARQVWETVQQQAQADPHQPKVWLLLPGLMTPQLLYMHYEDTQASQLRFRYSDAPSDPTLTRAQVDQILAQVFGASIDTASLDGDQRAQVLAVDCVAAAGPRDSDHGTRAGLCGIVQNTVWVRALLEQIPVVLGAQPAVPLVVDLHLYGGGYQQQLAWADAGCSVRKSLARYPEVRYVVVEQGSPLSSVLVSDLVDPTAAFQDLARDLPKSALSLLAAGVQRIPIRPPVSESAAWPAFDLYGLTDANGQNPRPAYHATSVLMRLLGGETEGARLVQRLAEQAEIYELRPVAGAPTFVLWSRDGQRYRAELRLSTTEGVQVTESPTTAAAAVTRTICAGTDRCALTIGDTALYISGTDTLQLLVTPGAASCLVPQP